MPVPVPTCLYTCACGLGMQAKRKQLETWVVTSSGRLLVINPMFMSLGCCDLQSRVRQACGDVHSVVCGASGCLHVSAARWRAIAARIARSHIGGSCTSCSASTCKQGRVKRQERCKSLCVVFCVRVCVPVQDSATAASSRHKSSRRSLCRAAYRSDPHQQCRIGASTLSMPAGRPARPKDRAGVGVTQSENRQ